MLALVVAASAITWLVVLAQGAATGDPNTVVWASAPAFVLVVGLVEVLKRAGLPSRYAGLAAVVIGVAGGVSAAVAGDLEIALHTGIMQGIMVGLAASGAWSTTRSVGQFTGPSPLGYRDDDHPPEG